MFPIKPQHVARVTFATRLYPTIPGPTALSASKIKQLEGYDGQVFGGGRSKNRDLLTHFGFLCEAPGGSSFVQLPLLRRSLKKLVNIVEDELNVLGCQEFCAPSVVPERLWKKSGRLKRNADALNNVYRLKDNEDRSLLLGPTFEETITNLVAIGPRLTDAELPLMLYQTTPKYRQEPNTRFGLIRCNEFLMNDLYTFDSSLETAKATYERVSSVYRRIFEKLGLECMSVQSEPGNIGGVFSHEYQMPVPSGEDITVVCNNCGHTANQNMFENPRDVVRCMQCGDSDISPLRTLELGHTFLLSDTYSKPFKAKYTRLADGQSVDFQMGCYGLGLTRILGAGIDRNTVVNKSSDTDQYEVQLRWPNKTEPFALGIVAPVKRSKQYHNNSTQWIERLVDQICTRTKGLDVIIEDRDKAALPRKLAKLKGLGIPNIIVIGSKFLEQPPEVEFWHLETESSEYQKRYFTLDQVCDYLTKLDSKQYE